jgi:glutathione peroxidase
MMAKTEVNGPGRDAVYQELTQLADGEGQAGDVQWNFEKFLVAGGKPVRRIRPLTDPESSEVVEAIEAALG